MGLASALTTALTGLTAAETQIDVVGNNLANSQTVGYKASETVFATQFLRTLAIGSAPTGSNGGTNPRQIGLGTQVAEIAPNFSQGTVEISSNPSDLAIQGDGFFIVEGGGGGEQLYTRNGIFKTNGDNELVTVTGNRLLGYQVDDTFTLQSTQVVPLTIPLGSASVAQATTIMTMEGALTPVGDIADTAEVVESAVLGDSNVPRPDIAGSGIVAADVADSTAVAIAHNDTGGGLEEGQTYRYRIAFVDDGGTEAPPSDEIVVTIPAGNATDDNQVTLNGLPAPLTGQYASVNVYRTSAGGTNDFGLVGTAAVGASFTDTGLTAPGAALDDSTIDGNYSYLITYHLTGVAESRPSVAIGPQNVVDGRIQLTDLPTPPVPVSGAFPAYDEVRIYRNLASDSSSFYLVDTVAPGTDYTDNKTDAEISDLTNPNNKAIDLDGPRVNTFTLLTDVVKRDGLTYEQIFKEGDLGFTGRKGGRQLDTTDFTIDATTTVQDLIDFMQASMGVQTSSDDPQDPIPGSLDKTSSGATGTLATGGSIVDGRIRFVSNNGVDNALDIGLSAFLNNGTDGTQASPNLGFGSIQEAEGQSAVSDFIVYDSLGVPIKVRLTAVLEARTGTQTTYRWFADSPDNDPLSGTEIAVGTGLLSFDGQGNFINTTNNEVSIERRNIPSASPLAFDLDFGAVSGLAVSESTLAAARQDGTPPGTLNSFVIGEDGFIRGVFSNGATRTLGAIRLARFSNPTGLAQRGENLFSAGSNSGLPVQGGPGQNGLGQIVAGAVELSNTDIGQNLIDLVLAQTQYRGNTRVISAAQQLLDELLSLRR